MPRRARIMLPGVPVHVIQRGNNRGACFFADEDYTLYLDALKDLAEKFSCAIHAYVLMTNHVHVLVTAQEPDGVSLVMKNLGQRYVQYANGPIDAAEHSGRGDSGPASRSRRATFWRATGTSS